MYKSIENVMGKIEENLSLIITLMSSNLEWKATLDQRTLKQSLNHVKK